MNKDSISLGNNFKHRRFIDLFAGLGGFHVGMSRLGHKCVLASEIDPKLRSVYEKNFFLVPEGDIREIDEESIPDHDVLCAGFPCQPFSRAGNKKGIGCEFSGKLIDDVLRIVKAKEPKYIMLENVPDILTIDEGRFWEYIKSGLNRLGYCVDFRVYMPQDFGIPQKRKRVFVIASRTGLDHFAWPNPKKSTPNLSMILDKKPRRIKPLTAEKELVLNLWQEFVDSVKEFTSLPILSAEFGATYPYKVRVKTIKEMSRYRGAFGASLRECKRWGSIRNILPKYSRDNHGLVSSRVAEAIKYSRALYQRNEVFLDLWKEGIKDMPTSWSKFEWQGNRDNPEIWEHIIQFRASGIRIIKPCSAPSLVAMTTTQIPIIGAEKRYMSVSEAATIQSLNTLKYFPEPESASYKALGNAVNAHIVSKIAQNLVI